MTAGRRLLSFEFVGVCAVAFLALCNVTVFYDLFGHLASLGIPAELRGLLVGVASGTAMVLYALASPFVTAKRAPAAMLAGMAVLAASGWGYLAVESFPALLALRIANGAGGFLLGAGASALLVAVIPPERSGQAFGLYSVAILVAFGLVPAVMDALAPSLPGRAHGYAAATLVLLPAALLVLAIRRRLGRAGIGGAPERRLVWPEIRDNLRTPSVGVLLALNTLYFANWSALFYLFEGFARQEGIGNVGAFFSVLTAIMIVFRLLAGRLFDRADKVRLVGASFAVVALAHLALGQAPAGAIPLLGAFFGLGLGAGYPAINGLMFDRTPPRLRALNANIMLFAVQGGSFLGPSVGGALVAGFGYRGWFLASSLMAASAALLSRALVRRGTVAAGAPAP